MLASIGQLMLACIPNALGCDGKVIHFFNANIHFTQFVKEHVPYLKKLYIRDAIYECNCGIDRRFDLGNEDQK